MTDRCPQKSALLVPVGLWRAFQVRLSYVWLIILPRMMNSEGMAFRGTIEDPQKFLGLEIEDSLEL